MINEKYMVNSIIAVDQALTQQHEHSIQNLPNSARFVNVVQKMNTLPMTLTPLEYSCWSRHRTATAVGAFILFTGLAMSLGVLIIYFTSPEPTVRKCELKFTPIVPNPFEYNYDPRSVAAGDFNSDQWLDIVVANRAVHSITIFVGHENGTFTKNKTYPTDLYSAPCMVAVGDLNKDHRLDITVANFGTNSIGILLGSENGSFASQIVISTDSSRPLWIHIVDLNNDTSLDIVTANYGTHSIGILYGDGSGRFLRPIIYPTGYDSLPNCVIAGDINNDNQLDLIVVNYGTNTVGILLANENGTFSPQRTLPTGIDSHPYSIAVGYFNNDILLDIAVANYGTNSVGVLLGTANETFASQISYIVKHASPYSIGVGDFNKDNRLDIVVTNQGTNNIGVLLGYGDGTFSNATMRSTGSSSSISLAIADFNNDHLLDIIIINNDLNSISYLFSDNVGFQSQTRYSTGTYPEYVTVDDFNNDKRLDIVVANSHDNNIGLLLGYGNGSFAKQTTYSTGTRPLSVAVGDVNNDNQLDIVVANEYSNDVSVLLGHIDGSFANQTTYLTGSNPKSVAVGDFNNDTHLDIVVANFDDINIGVLLGYGNGSFMKQTTYTTSSYPRCVAIGDFNNDGLQDIIVILDTVENNVGVFLGNGNGSFIHQTTCTTGFEPWSMAVGDFNNDHYLDIVVVSLANNNNFISYVGILLGNGNGSFTNHTTYSSDRSLESVTVGDINNDTRLDIVVPVNFRFGSSAAVLLGYGNGSFANKTTNSVGYVPSSVALGDFNNDTRLDIVVANDDNSSVIVLLQSPITPFGNEIPFASDRGSRLRCIALDDLNHDNMLDIVVVNYGTDNIGVLLGYGNGSFREQTTFSTGLGSNPSSITTGYFNKDHHLDLSVANTGSKNVDMLLGNGNGTFARQITYGYGLNLAPDVIAAGDLNHDEQSEIIVAYSQSDNIDILIAYDTGNFTNQTTYSASPFLEFIAAGDFNNDRRLDIVVTYTYGNNVGIFLGYGNGSFANQTTYPTGSYPQSVAVGDLNNDGRLDIAVANRDDNNVGILLGYGNGSFANQTTHPTGFHPVFVAIGDFNKDNRLDIVVANSFDNRVGILLGYGNGSFANQTMYLAGSYPQSVAVGDFNDDTHLDIVVINYNDNNVGILLGYGNGSFASQTTYSAGSHPQSVAVGDFNDDTHLDIVVTNYDDNNAGVLLGYGNGSFANQTTYTTGNSPSFVAVGDLNNDRRLDVVVANAVHNNIGILLGYGNGSFKNQITYSTGYRPWSLATGDFNNDSLLDIVVANSVASNVGVFLGVPNLVFVPFMTLTTSSGSRPHAFAIADFNNDTHMDIGVANSGTDNVGIHLGYGNGSFTNQTTYAVGNAPWSLAAGDLNNDTHLDIVVADSNDDNVGVLLGHGNGSFANQTTYSTGSDSQPSSVAVVDLNNDTFLDIIVANYGNNNVVGLLGHGNGTFHDPQVFSLYYGSMPFSVVTGDFNDDKKQDFAVANYGTDNLQIFLQTC